MAGEPARRACLRYRGGAPFRPRTPAHSDLWQEIGQPEDMTTTADPVQLCTETIKTVQMASDALLLRDRDQPLSRQPFSGCCDTLVAHRKALTIAATNADANLKANRPLLLCKVRVAARLLLRCALSAARGGSTLPSWPSRCASSSRPPRRPCSWWPRTRPAASARRPASWTRASLRGFAFWRASVGPDPFLGGGALQIHAGASPSGD